MKFLFSIKPAIKFTFIRTSERILFEFLCFVFILIKKPKYSWETDKTCFVLCESKQEYLKWCVNTNRNPSQFKYIESEKHLMLKLDVCDEIYLVGGYKLESLELINKISSKVNCVISKT